MTKRNPSSNGLVLIYVRAGADGHKSRHSIPLSCKVSDLKNKVKISHRVDGDVRLIFLGRLLEDNKTVGESGLFDECTVTLVATNKYSLCPDGAELADMENGAPLDAVISLYMSRLCHTGALSNLVELINSGGVPATDLIEVNDDSGAIVPGRLTFENVSHMLTYVPRTHLQASTMYTVTIKQNSLMMKKEIADLRDPKGSEGPGLKPLRYVISEPEYSFTFTTSDSTWRQLAVYRRTESEPWPSGQVDLVKGPLAVARTIVLKNADEVMEGLIVHIAEALGVDEDEDIISVYSMSTNDQGSVQLTQVNHSNVAALASGDKLLVTLKGDSPSPKKQCISHESAIWAAGTSFVPGSSSAGSNSAVPARRPAKERMIELKDLFDLGLISEAEFESKKKAIIESI